MSKENEIQLSNHELVSKQQTSWQNRDEWFFNREYTDTYEKYYEGPYKRAEVWQKKILENLIKKDIRVKTLLEFGCGTTWFTRWWHEIGIEASGGDISPFMLSQALFRFNGDLVMADSHYMPFKDNTYDALAFITTFEYYKDPVKVLREAARVARYGIIMGMMNRNTPKLLRRRTQQAFGRNNFYVTATFYTPNKLKAVIDEALQGRDYTIRWKTTGLPKWFPVQEWNMPLGDFFGMYIQFNDVEE
ncbi:MAG: class I SAM-dependent methyltransferase [Bacteroidales bacterium]|nr:class I SAM-dependent methyltransferase [Bacteroidales bacterium]